MRCTAFPTWLVCTLLCGHWLLTPLVGRAADAICCPVQLMGQPQVLLRLARARLAQLGEPGTGRNCLPWGHS